LILVNERRIPLSQIKDVSGEPHQSAQTAMELRDAMNGRLTMLAAAIALNTAAAQGADIAAGLNSARTLCVNCHVVEPKGSAQKALTAGIPSFMVIANKKDQSESKLKAFMLDPHPPMPQVQLTTHELDNLASYILSLKD
jgi:mono/diheme cytochrome c family protein